MLTYILLLPYIFTNISYVNPIVYFKKMYNNIKNIENIEKCNKELKKNINYLNSLYIEFNCLCIKYFGM